MIFVNHGKTGVHKHLKSLDSRLRGNDNEHGNNSEQNLRDFRNPTGFTANSK